MAKQRLINTKTWDDEWFTELNIIEKLLFLYFLTNALTDICGGYEISIKRIVFDTGIERDEVLKTLEKFEKAKKVFYRDGWILIENFIKHQAQSPKILAGIRNSLKNCPDWIKDRVSISYPTLSIGYQYGINTPSHSNSNSNSNSNININSTPPNPPEAENSNGNGVRKKNGIGRVGGSKFSEEVRRQYAKSQSDIKDVDAYVNSTKSKKGDFDGRVEKWAKENCLGCNYHKNNRLNVPPCPKHGDESFVDWKNKIIDWKKRECRDCRSYSQYPDESPKCEKHGYEEKLNRNFQSLIENNLTTRGLNPADYFSSDFKTLAVDKAKLEFSAE